MNLHPFEKFDRDLLNAVHELATKIDKLNENVPLSEEAFQDFYSQACVFYENNQSQEAENIFLLLISMRPHIKTLWMGLAGAKQKQNNYQGALQAYAMAALLDSDDPIPHYYAALCNIELNHFDDTIKALDIATSLCSTNSQYFDLYEKIINLNSRIKGVNS
jgi:type III secretion system low calcium response chaperone LcrH/SycD